mmetsp:Transcript_34395/g.47657  ORF Transcript_34395/g.47657 Transcript_34395/m.47657 type:complete len:259 (+) Transcript_34395:3374-4150(+)
MRGRHGGPRDGVACSIATNPGALDVRSGGIHVAARPVVGERRTLIGTGGGGNGIGVWRGCGGRRAGIGVRVSCSHCHRHPRCEESTDGVVGGLTVAASQGHGGHGRGDVIGGDPVHSGNYTRGSARSTAAQNAHSMQRGPLRNAIGSAQYSACTVGAVPVAVFGIIVVVYKVPTSFHSSSIVRVSGINASVNNIHMNTSPVARRSIGVVVAYTVLINAVQTPEAFGNQSIQLDRNIAFGVNDVVTKKRLHCFNNIRLV